MAPYTETPQCSPGDNAILDGSRFEISDRLQFLMFYVFFLTFYFSVRFDRYSASVKT